MTGERHPFDPDWCIKPGETLREWMDEHHLSSRVFARTLGVDVSVVDGILTGRRRITRDVAGRLARVVGVTPRFWLNLEKQYRAGLAAGKTEGGAS